MKMSLIDLFALHHFTEEKKAGGSHPILLPLLLVSSPASGSSHVAPNLEDVSGEEVDGNTQQSANRSLTYEKRAITSF